MLIYRETHSYLKIQGFKDVTSHQLVNSYCIFRGAQYLHLQVQKLQEDCLTLKVEVLCSSATLVFTSQHDVTSQRPEYYRTTDFIDTP